MIILLWLLLGTLQGDGDIFDFVFSLTPGLLADPVVAKVDLVDGLSGGVVDSCVRSCFGYVHTLLVDQVDKLPPLVVWNWLVFFSHVKFCL